MVGGWRALVTNVTFNIWNLSVMKHFIDVKILWTLFTPETDPLFLTSKRSFILCQILMDGIVNKLKNSKPEAVIAPFNTSFFPFSLSYFTVSLNVLITEVAAKIFLSVWLRIMNSMFGTTSILVSILDSFLSKTSLWTKSIVVVKDKGLQ